MTLGQLTGLVMRSRLRSQEKLVLLAIGALSEGDAVEAVASMADIAQKASMHQRQARRWVASLRERGCIEARGGFGTPATYSILPRSLETAPVTDDRPGRRRPPRTLVTPVVEDRPGRRRPTPPVVEDLPPRSPVTAPHDIIERARLAPSSDPFLTPSSPAPEKAPASPLFPERFGEVVEAYRKCQPGLGAAPVSQREMEWLKGRIEEHGAQRMFEAIDAAVGARTPKAYIDKVLANGKAGVRRSAPGELREVHWPASPKHSPEEVKAAAEEFSRRLAEMEKREQK